MFYFLTFCVIVGGICVFFQLKDANSFADFHRDVRNNTMNLDGDFEEEED